MIAKIDLIQPTFSQYGVQHHFTQGMHAALRQLGVKSRLLDINEADRFCDIMRQDPPDCTLSFNGLLPDEQGRLVCDITGIPHVSYLIDSLASYFLHLTRSPLSILTCIDRTAVDFFHGIGFDKVLFMPHAVESSLHAAASSPRAYDAVMISSCIDYEEISAGWKRAYAPSLCLALEEAARMILTDSTMPTYMAVTNMIDKQMRQTADFDARQIDLLTMLDEVEMFARGKDRVQLLQNIKTTPVHVFGSGNWHKYLGSQANICLHPAVSFEQALGIMQQSKIVLNSCPTIKKGLHERLLAGIACGALVISSENTYLQTQFAEGISIAFYRYGKWQAANDCLVNYLDNETKRRQVVVAGQQIVKSFHTWEHRAAELLKALPPLLVG